MIPNAAKVVDERLSQRNLRLPVWCNVVTNPIESYKGVQGVTPNAAKVVDERCKRRNLRLPVWCNVVTNLTESYKGVQE